MNSALAPEMPMPMPADAEPSLVASSSTSASTSTLSPSTPKQPTFGQSFMSTLNLLLNTPLVPPPPTGPMEVQLQEMPSSRRSSYMSAPYGQPQERRGSVCLFCSHFCVIWRSANLVVFAIGACRSAPLAVWRAVRSRIGARSRWRGIGGTCLMRRCMSRMSIRRRRFPGEFSVSKQRSFVHVSYCEFFRSFSSRIATRFIWIGISLQNTTLLRYKRSLLHLHT